MPCAGPARRLAHDRAHSGAALGFVAYATYDLTNQATLKVWSTTVTLADLAWGTFVTGVASAAGCYLTIRLSRLFAG